MVKIEFKHTPKVMSLALGTAAFVAFSSVLALSSSVSAMTLIEALEIAIETNPEILEADASRRATARELDAANSFYLPRVDFAAAYGIEYSNNTTTRARTENSTGKKSGMTLRRTETSLTVTETLFNGFAREREIDRQTARVDSARNRTRERGEAVALDVVRAYLDVLRNQAIVGLAKANLETHKGINDDIRGRVDAGQSGIGDLQQTAARLSNSKATLSEVKLDLQEAYVAFEKAVGQVPGSLTDPKFDQNVIPASRDDALVLAINSSPVLKLASADELTTQAEIGIAKARYYPELDLEFAGSNNNNLDGVRGRNKDFTGMIKLRYNLFNGGADRARHREALERNSQSRAALARLRRVVEEETRLSWDSMIFQDEQVLARQDLVVSSAQVVETYRQEFQIGQRDLLDLLDSENELFNAQTKLLTAESAAKFARYRLIASTGKLLSYLNLKVLEKPLVD